MSNSLELRFIGEHVKPAGERAHDIGEVISAFEESISAIVLRQHPRLKRDSIAVSLVGIEKGSIALLFEPNLDDVIFSATRKLVEAIQNKEWAALPSGTRTALRKILRFVSKRECVVQFKVAHNDVVISTVLAPDTIIPASVSLFGETEIFGEVKRVGGSEPKVEIKTLQGETLYCNVTEVIARQLGSQLYEQVGVYGVAEWNFETLEIEEFEITRVSGHAYVSPNDAFEKLSEAFGPYFEDITDVEQWAYEIRHGEVDKV